jgi:hypothetical protein
MARNHGDASEIAAALRSMSGQLRERAEILDQAAAALEAVAAVHEATELHRDGLREAFRVLAAEKEMLARLG